MARKSKTIGRGQQTQEINQVNRGMKDTVPQSGDAKKMKRVNVLQATGGNTSESGIPYMYNV
ncbi:hypothetical protein RDI58_000218 [Solanum bulbocastanum]|uniref:Uncharacterized protein n=1 Tax=Solanum bulbocastanum TaxID=147425 RepID=A0AAN8YM67_SOLBU